MKLQHHDMHQSAQVPHDIRLWRQYTATIPLPLPHAVARISLRPTKSVFDRHRGISGNASGNHDLADNERKAISTIALCSGGVKILQGENRILVLRDGRLQTIKPFRLSILHEMAHDDAKDLRDRVSIAQA
jgi:hypothetical protein